MNLEQGWVFFKRHQQAGWQILLALFIFAAGWQTGRVMSPFYASHPIVFNDRECSACSTSGGSEVELTKLQEEGRGLLATQEPTTAAAVAGSSTALEEDLFVGSINSDKYHHRDCSTWSRIKEENRVWWGSATEAEAAGYEPTKCTQELLP